MINDYTPQKLIAKLIFSTLVCSSPLTNSSSVKDRGHFDENLFLLKKSSQFTVCTAVSQCSVELRKFSLTHIWQKFRESNSFNK